MQDKPEAADLIEAIQEFMKKDVLPRLKDDSALSFKGLVSWNMLGVLARETRQGRDLRHADMDVILKILKDTEGPLQEPTQANWLDLQKRLARQIQQDDVHSPASREWQVARESLQRKLQIANPRFSTQ